MGGPGGAYGMGAGNPFQGRGCFLILGFGVYRVRCAGPRISPLAAGRNSGYHRQVLGLAMNGRNLESAAERMISEFLGVRIGERVLILTDRKYAPLARELLLAARRKSGRALLRFVHELRSQEPPPAVARLMARSDVVVSVAGYSLTHSRARREACRKGARMVTLPSVPEDSFLRGGMRADPFFVRAVVEEAYRALKGARNFEVTSANGTRMRLEVAASRTWIRESGLVRHRGEFDNLPAGELAMLPRAGTACGSIVFDFLRGCKGSARIKVRRGFIESVRGDPAARELFGCCGKKSERLAEFALGCNPWARVMDNTLESEKVLGTCHFAFGNDVIFGGRNSVPFHRDGIIHRPTIKCGGEIVVRNGRWSGVLGRALRSARTAPARASL